MDNDPAIIAKLLRAISNGSDAKALKQDVIFNAAAEWLELLATFSQQEMQSFGNRKN
jgi:hypothetical protein